MNKIICVYSSSSNLIGPQYFQLATTLGQAIASRGDTLLFGGGLIGLMGATAQAVQANQGRVIGVIPEALNQKGIVYELCDELIITPGLRERKAIMDSRSDAFIALPGGFGTLEEVLEIITLKQLRYHQKPIVILNIDGFYDPLLQQFTAIIERNFAVSESKQLYLITDSIDAGLTYIDSNGIL